MSEEIRPNFFIVGAPKSGTTSMHEYLAEHPGIFMAEHKELHYFGKDLRFRHRPKLDAYMGNFVGAEGFDCVGESSVMYLYSTTAANEIKEFSPDARILIMLRHPVDMVYSLHSQAIFTGDEELLDFEKALAVEPERRAGQRRMRSKCDDYLMYRGQVDYAPQVQRYLDTFGSDRVLVILFDELTRDVADAYRRTVEFVGCDPTFQADFSIRNANKVVKHPRLQRLLRNPPYICKRLSHGLIPGAIRKPIARSMLDWNVDFGKRPPMDTELRKRLQQEMTPQIKDLAKVLDRDLSAWLEPKGKASS